MPTGPGVRVDSFGYSGYATSPHFDSLLAKVICHHTAPELSAALKKTRRALADFTIGGLQDQRRLSAGRCSTHEEVTANRLHTRFVDSHIAELVAGSNRNRIKDGRPGSWNVGRFSFDRLRSPRRPEPS